MEKKRRVKRKEEFQSIIKSADKVVSLFYVVYYQPKKEEFNRIGISVSKKLGIAVKRNLIKRQVRMIVCETDALTLDQDLIIIVRKSYDSNQYEESKKDFKNILKKVKIKTDLKGDVDGD